MGIKFKDRFDLEKAGLKDCYSDRGWHFGDYLQMDVVGYDAKSLDRIKDDYPGAFKPTTPGTPHPTGLGTEPTAVQNSTPAAGKGLVVYVAATHAGLITRNNGFYMPDRMRAGINSWTDLYPKPVQIHHEDHADPVGRVISAEYVDTSNLVADNYKDFVLRDSMKKKVGHADAAFWKDFVGDEKSFIQKLQMVKLMDSVLEDKHYRGVGYTKLALDITDPETAQKILDGRYMTVSIGAVSDKAVCSVCDTNWLEEEHCGHRPGKVYDGKRCFVIAGNLENDEVSWVNTPADRHASVLGIQQQGGFTDSVREHGLFMFPIADNFRKEDSVMENENTDAEAPKEQVTDGAQTTEEQAAASAENPQGTAEAGNTQDAAATSAESAQDSTDEGNVQDDTNSDEVENSLQKIFDDRDTDALYEAMTSELADEAKLSKEALAKLPGSAFCGPDRTIPVTDEAHVAAALALLDKLELEDELKEEILAKVNRKAKVYGYSTTKDSVTPAPVENEVKDARLTSDVVRSLLSALDLGLYGSPWDEDSESAAPVLTDEDAKSLRMMIAELVKRIGKDNFEAALASEGLATNKDEFDAQVAEAERLEDNLGEKMDQLDALRQELRASYADMAALQDQLVDLTDKLKNQKVERLAAYHQLDGSLTDEVKDELLKLTDEGLDTKLDMLSKQVDISKIADKVNDGLSRTPDEQVENPVPPVTNEPSAVEDKTPPRKPTYQTQAWVDHKYRQFLVVEQNPEKANAFYKDAVTKGMAEPRPTDLE